MTLSWSPAPILIAGPCALESDDINLAIGERLAELNTQLGLRVLYKGSFDKANRSAVDAPRGPGLEEGLRALERVRTATGLPVVTDVHEVAQVRPVSDVVDALLDGAIETLQSHGVAESRTTVVRVPGAFEVPLVARRLASRGGFDAIITLGAVVRGDTPHFDYVAV